MSDFNIVDDLAEELGNFIDDNFVEDSSNTGVNEEIRKDVGDRYPSSQLEDELEGSLVGINTNASDFTEASGSHAEDRYKLKQLDKRYRHEPKKFKLKPAETLESDDIELGRNLAKRGVFSSDDLTDENLFTTALRPQDFQRNRRFQPTDVNLKELNDPGLSDRHCVLRLPEYAANMVKKRMEAGEPLGMKLAPTGRYDFREFKITIKGLSRPLYGVLGELPCIVEAHKTLNNDLLFKSADISQLMIAYEKKESEKVIEVLKEKMWEWPDGLTEGTENIRRRRFKEKDEFTNEEVKEAERESLILMNGLTRDTYHFEIKTTQEVNDLVQNYRNGNIKERVIGPDEDVSVYIRALEEQETEDMPDLSEIMFDTEISSIPNRFVYNNIKSRIFSKH
ncbi:hypothetical protein MACJ_001419 [Theileria orientalis]|uniref:TAFII55 protein conserved region domain-containing protein n=1 Tax=Theileria orientalis TaxID=68886 RepID=A0A976M8G5_THEOR|nr:hypothetical protein MACJ_001419 [Theileria orientalis]